MFGTVILDAYTKAETEELAAAIDDLCCPKDHYGWASAGIYSFWDYNTHEVLYIGLASDLYERFRRNTLKPTKNLDIQFLCSLPYHSHSYTEIKIYMKSWLRNIIHRSKTI